MITGKTLRDAIISGANNIANQRTRVDELNVFPVPDGDTGTNMSMTIGAALSELNAMPDTCTVAEASKSAASAMRAATPELSPACCSAVFPRRWPVKPMPRPLTWPKPCRWAWKLLTRRS